MIDRCHQRNTAVALYVSVIHDRWASDEHPDWRIIHPNGGDFGRGSRSSFWETRARLIGEAGF